MTDPTTFKRRTTPDTSANIFLIFLSVLTKTNFTSHTPMNEAKKKGRGGGRSVAGTYGNFPGIDNKHQDLCARPGVSWWLNEVTSYQTESVSSSPDPWKSKKRGRRIKGQVRLLRLHAWLRTMACVGSSSARLQYKKKYMNQRFIDLNKQGQFLNRLSV